ncbi:centrosomal protein of 72 kDa isoform X3 [Hoplias malabaricus]
MQKHPYYRLYLVHAISKLRKLDDCAVRDRERKAAVMHFSEESAQPPTQSTNLFTEEKEKRSSEARVASVKKMMMMKLSLREGNEETVLNQKCTADGSGVATREDSLFTESEPLRLAVTNRRGTAHRRPSLRSHDAPRVTFLDPYVIRHSPEHLGESAKHSRSRKQAESNFTPHPSSKNTAGEGFQALIDGRIDVKAHQSISGDRNPVLHPPRLTHRSSEDGGDPQRPPIKPNRGERLCKGAYRKPLELLLGLVDEFWAGKKENHNSRHFFSGPDPLPDGAGGGERRRGDKDSEGEGPDSAEPGGAAEETASVRSTQSLRADPESSRICGAAGRAAAEHFGGECVSAEAADQIRAEPSLRAAERDVQHRRVRPVLNQNQLCWWNWCVCFGGLYVYRVCPVAEST